VPQLVITLLHGTFARGAPWTQLGSPLCQELQVQFGCNALLDRFDWSGDNSIHARLKAGGELAAHLDKLKTRFPLAKQYIVAHSHGGNVALYAARSTHVDGIACLATPFLHASVRDEALASTKAMNTAIFGFACFINFLVYVSISLGWLVWLSMLLFSFIFSAALSAYISGAIKGVVPDPSLLADSITSQVSQNTRFCIFRATGDEASLSLASGQLMAWSTSVLYASFVRANALRFLTQPLRGTKLPKAFWIVPAIGLLAQAIALREGSAAQTLSLVAFIAGLVSVLAALWIKTTFLDNFLFGIAFIGMWIATAVGSLMVGAMPSQEEIESRFVRWAVGMGILLSVDIYTEATPPGGPWEVYHQRDSDAQTGLVHSIYNNAGVRSRLVHWLASDHVLPEKGNPSS
jgi:hypothetical protein